MNLNRPILYFDGGARGNPGLGAAAAVVMLPEGTCQTKSLYLGQVTNNEAEYAGLILGLRWSLELGLSSLAVKGDSQLVINQASGNWKVKNSRLKCLCSRVRGLMARFDLVTLSWIPRQDNVRADQAVQECLERYLDKLRR